MLCQRRCDVELRKSDSAWIILHQVQHLPHRGRQANDYGAADQAVADVQLYQMRDFVERVEVLIIQTMPGIDF